MEIINPHRFAAAPVVDFDGFGNASRYFDGVNDYVSIPDFAHSNSNLTCMCWVKTSDTNFKSFFSHWDTNNQRAWLMQLDSTSGLLCSVTSQGNSGYKIYYTQNDTIADGTWHHCAFSFSQNDLRLFIDGVRITDLGNFGNSTVNTIYNSPADILIGADLATGAAASHIDGSVADCRIYDATLTEAQIATIAGGGDYTTNLVGHWLKDTPSLLDHSGTNDGTNVGSAFAYDNPSPAVEFGKASRSFDGVNAYISMGDVLDSVFAGTGKQFTIAAWIKTTTLENTDFFSKYLTSGNQRSFTCRVLSDGNLAMVMSGDGALGNRWGRQTDTAPISANTWHHVAITYDQTATGDYLRMWVNGVEDATLVDWLSNGTFTSIYDGTAATRISGIDRGFNENWGGNIADVRVYDTNLSSTDIAAIYNGTHVETNLIGHWLTNTDDVKDYAGVNDGTNFGSTYSFDNPLSEGEFGSASRSFDGVSDYVSIPDFLHSTSNLTCMCWVKTSDTSGKSFFSHWDLNNQRSWIMQVYTNGGLLCGVDATGTSSARKIYYTNDSIADGTWHHCAFSFSANDLRVYIDGVRITNLTLLGDDTVNTIHNSTSDILIGASLSTTPTWHIAGSVADCRIYDATLSAQDIFDLSRGYDYRTNLIGHWLTNKDDVDDYAGTNHGTNNGSTYSLDAPL